MLDVKTGAVLFSIPTASLGVSAFGDRIVAQMGDGTSDSSRMYDLDGALIGNLEGSPSYGSASDLSDDQMKILTYSSSAKTGYVYDRSGKRLWSAQGGAVFAFCGGRAVVLQGVGLTTDGSASFVGRDPTGGAVAWSVPKRALPMVSGAACDGAHLIVGYADAGRPLGVPTSIVAYNVADGKVAWQAAGMSASNGTSNSDGIGAFGAWGTSLVAWSSLEESTTVQQFR